MARPRAVVVAPFHFAGQVKGVLELGVTRSLEEADLDFLKLMADARLVLTDSGGIQEETTALGVPCLTLRANTERPVTVSHGSNRLVGMDPQEIVAAYREAMSDTRPAQTPPFWDGHAAERIVRIIGETYSQKSAA